MAKKYLDQDGVLYFWQKIKAKLSTKVDKIDGKGLSTNDYTTAEKTKLAGLSNYSLPTASADTLGGVKVGGGLSITNGVLSATGGGTADAVEWNNVLNKPTKVSQFTNDANYVTTTVLNNKGYQTADQVNAIVSGVIDSAPEALNTLNELAAALGDDPNFATTMTTELGKKVDEADLVAVTNTEIDTIVAQ